MRRVGEFVILLAVLEDVVEGVEGMVEEERIPSGWVPESARRFLNHWDTLPFISPFIIFILGDLQYVSSSQIYRDVSANICIS